MIVYLVSFTPEDELLQYLSQQLQFYKRKLKNVNENSKSNSLQRDISRDAEKWLKNHGFCTELDTYTLIGIYKWLGI